MSRLEIIKELEEIATSAAVLQQRAIRLRGFLLNTVSTELTTPSSSLSEETKRKVNLKLQNNFFKNRKAPAVTRARK